MEKNIIYNEDCFETMKNKINSKSIDCVLTSPPYNMTKRKGGVTDSGRYDVYKDWMSEEEYINFSVKLFENFDKIVNNQTTSIKFENLKAICDILECTPNDLFDEYYNFSKDNSN